MQARAEHELEMHADDDAMEYVAAVNEWANAKERRGTGPFTRW